MGIRNLIPNDLELNLFLKQLAALDTVSGEPGSDRTDRDRVAKSLWSIFVVAVMGECGFDGYTLVHG